MVQGLKMEHLDLRENRKLGMPSSVLMRYYYTTFLTRIMLPVMAAKWCTLRFPDVQTEWEQLCLCCVGSSWLRKQQNCSQSIDASSYQGTDSVESKINQNLLALLIYLQKLKENL